jgi:hypothetical protein
VISIDDENTIIIKNVDIDPVEILINKIPSTKYLQQNTFNKIPSTKYLQQNTFNKIPSTNSLLFFFQKRN